MSVRCKEAIPNGNPNEFLTDLYKVLEPFMIIDGKPLDNTLSFNGYNFARHKTIHFENDKKIFKS